MRQIPPRLVRPDVLWFPIAFPFQVEPRDARCGSYSRRPRIEVKPIESDSLRADGEHIQERTNVAIEAIFVHAEIGGRVAQSNEAR